MKKVRMAALCVFGAFAAFAEDYVWNGGASGEWTQAANWLPP